MLESSFPTIELPLNLCATALLLVQRRMEFRADAPRQRAAEDDALLERRKTTAALHEAEARYRSIFENAFEGIFQSTPDGTYVIVNPALARMYGYDSPDSLIRGIGDISRQLYVDPGRRREFVERMQRDGSVTSFESQVYRRDGSIIWISETSRAVVVDGRVTHYEGTVVDITERKQLEEWRRQKEAADAANHAKSSFLARVSHEIRTPLNGVIGMLEVLAGSPLNHQQQQQVRIARSSAMSLLGLMNDLLDFSKIEAGRLELEQAPFSPRIVAGEVAEAFAHVAAAKHLDLKCVVDDDVPQFLLGDPERVRQILVNLVNNALKFTERGHVNLIIERDADGKSIRIRVADTGIGIPESRRDRLFHDFMQVDSSTSRKYGGTGLGLAICRQLVELMNGQITVVSQVDVGSEFRVRLPLPEVHSPARPVSCRQLAVMAIEGPHQSAILQADPQSSAHESDSGDSTEEESRATVGRLLLVEDNEINQMVAVELLTMSGWEVDVANNGLEAVAAAQRVGYDAILMDCQMPEMDGLTASREIRLLEAAGRLPRYTHELVPIIAFTANAAPEDREQCLAAGMNAFAAKPLVIDQLLDTIEQAVPTKKSNRSRLVKCGSSMA